MKGSNQRSFSMVNAAHDSPFIQMNWTIQEIFQQIGAQQDAPSRSQFHRVPVVHSLVNTRHTSQPDNRCPFPTVHPLSRPMCLWASAIWRWSPLPKPCKSSPSFRTSSQSSRRRPRKPQQRPRLRCREREFSLDIGWISEIGWAHWLSYWIGSNHVES